MVLAGGHRKDVLTVHHDNEAGFFAVKIILNDDAGARIAEFVVLEHEIDGFVRVFFGHGNNDTFACGQAVGFDDDRSTFAADISMSGFNIRKGLVFSCRDAVTLHEGFSEVLRRFQLSSFFGRSEDL